MTGRRSPWTSGGVGPLAQTRVLDLSNYLMGPLAGLVLTDLGADVIKVERPPAGDLLRRIGARHLGSSGQWVTVNRGKRTVFLDLRSDEGRDALLELVEDCDVLLHNWRPGVADSLGLGDAILSASNPRLVRVYLTGWGMEGPMRDRPAFDALVQSHLGLAARQATPDGPEPIRTYVADKVTGLFAAQLALAALVQRAETGLGSRVEVSMLAATAYFTFPDVMDDLAFVDRPVDGTEGPPANLSMATLDGHVAVAPVSGAQLNAAFAALGHPEWTEEVRGLGAEMLGAALGRIAGAAAEITTEALVAALVEADVPCCPVLSREEHLNDAQVVSTGIYGTYDHAELGTVRYPRFPGRFDGVVPHAAREETAMPGADTAGVLEALGRGDLAPPQTS